MRNTLYQYNAETCQYERVRVKTPDVLFYLSGIFVVALLMLAGMLTLHDYIFDSPREITLRSENAALAKNQVILTSQLNTIESTLSELGTEDEKLHEKFFGSPMEKMTDFNVRSTNKHLLLADPSTFRSVAETMGGRSSELLSQSATTSSFYGNQLSLTKERLKAIVSMPLLQPIQPWHTANLLSGFGMRVNPFHKGLYEHPGVDIAMPRGSAVIATASGTVIEISKSTVQAGYGNYIEIDHGNGFITRYAHLEDVQVKYRQKVTKGSVIATVGNSGGSIAPHLHYEIIRDGITVDPVHYMIEGLSSNEHHQLKLISQKQNQSLD
jgi:murein DD-endopeptidase MepM/ murein hydrolase activator NlpD